LSGGEGTRLRPFTLTTPKPLLSVANIPLIAYQFSLLKKHNIDEVIVGVGYKADYFKKVISPLAKKAGVKSILSPESKPLGTGGGLRNAYGFFKNDKEPFVVFNGDVIADFNLGKILAVHKEKGAYATIGLVKVNDPASYGLVIIDTESNIKKFIEKPKREEIVADTINAGVYVFSPAIFDEIQPGRPVSIEREVFPYLLEKGMKMMGYIHYGYWMDVGTVDKYRKVNFDVLDGKLGFDHKTVESDDGKILTGERSILKEGVRIRGRVIIGDNCFVGKDSLLEDSIILSNTVIRDRCVVSGSIIGTEVIIENDCVIKDTVLADRSLLSPFTKTEPR